MQELRAIILGGGIALVLSGCGSTDVCERPQSYVNARESAVLVVPEGLTPPQESRVREIPPVGDKLQARTDPCTARPPLLVSRELATSTTTPAIDKSGNELLPTAAAPLNVGKPYNNQSVEKTVNAWVKSWANGQAPRYLAFYSKDFHGTDEAVDRTTWLARRQQLILDTGKADITIKDLRVEPLPGGRKMVRLVQQFVSENNRQAVVKILEMVQEDGGWRIRSERVVGLEQ